MDKKSSKKSWTDKVKDTFFVPIVKEENKEVIEEGNSHVAEAYFRGKWKEENGAKWAFFKSKSDERKLDTEESESSESSTVELLTTNTEKLVRAETPETRKTKKIDEIVSITELGRASSDSRYNREPVVSKKQTEKKSGSGGTTPLEKKAVSQKTTPLEKKEAFKQMVAPIKKKDTQTTHLPRKVPEGSKSVSSDSSLSGLSGKAVTLQEESHKWSYFRKSQNEKIEVPYKSTDKTFPICEIKDTKKVSTPIPAYEPENTQNSDSSSSFKGDGTSDKSSDKVYTHSQQTRSHSQPPVTQQKPLTAFNSTPGRDDEFSSLYPGLYGQEAQQNVVDYQNMEMGYPQGYPPTEMGYPQGYPPPGMAYPPPGMAYPQGYLPVQYPNIEVIMIQQILNYLLQSGIFTQLQGFLHQTNLPPVKNEMVIGEVVKKVLEEVKKQNPEGTINQMQESYIQTQLTETISAFNFKKTDTSDLCVDTNNLEITSGELKGQQDVTRPLNHQMPVDIKRAPETSFPGGKDPSPQIFSSFSQITSPLNLAQAPSTTPLILNPKMTSPLNLAQAPSTTPLRLDPDLIPQLNLPQAPSTTPLKSDSLLTSPLQLSQAPSTTPLIMPSSNVTSPLELLNDWIKDEEIKKDINKEDSILDKEVYKRILKPTLSEETHHVEEEVEDWFKKKGLKRGEMTSIENNKKEKVNSVELIEKDEEGPLSITDEQLLSVNESNLSPGQINSEDINLEQDLYTQWDTEEIIIDDSMWIDILDNEGSPSRDTPYKDVLIDEASAGKVKQTKSFEVPSDSSEKPPDLLDTLSKCEQLLKSASPKPKKVLTLCKTLLASYPANPLVYHMISEAYEKLGKKEKAEKYRKKAEKFGY